MPIWAQIAILVYGAVAVLSWLFFAGAAMRDDDDDRT